MTQPNLVTDLSTLSKIPNKILNEIVHKLNLCIGSIIYEAKQAGEHAVVINIGLGTLSIDLVDMNCKFVPSKDLKQSIKDSLNAKIDPLELELENTLAEKLVSICEEVL